MKTLRIIAAVMAIFFAALLSESRAEDAGDIMDKAWRSFRSLKTEKETIRITAKGSAKKLYRWTLIDPGGEDKTLIKYVEPKLDQGLSLLTFRHADGKDEQWFKPADMKKSRKIDAGDYRKYFEDTDLTNEDFRRLLGETASEFSYKLLQKEGNNWVIEATPKPGVQSAYGKRTIRVNDRYQIVGIKYYDAAGNPVKTQSNEAMNTINGSWRPNRVVINNDSRGTKTIIEIEKREAGHDISPATFTQNFMESEDF